MTSSDKSCIISVAEEFSANHFFVSDFAAHPTRLWAAFLFVFIFFSLCCIIVRMEHNFTENTFFSSSLSAREITQIIVNKYRDSPAIDSVRTADKYYNNQNEAIDRKTRVYYDKDRNPVNNPFAYNARQKSNFLRMLVQQKQDYGFSKTFILKLSDENGNEIELNKNDYGKEWKSFLTKSLYKIVYALAGQAINHGIAWCFVRIDENGELELKSVPTDLVYPVWKDREHSELDRLVYNYRTETYKSLNPTIYEYAEYWSATERRLFNITNSYAEESVFINENNEPVYSHLFTSESGVSWGKIPFVPLKSNTDERTLLSFIKEKIDSYDFLDSKSVDGLIDDLDPILVLKGISPAVSDLLEARELARMTRTISVDSDGDASYIQAQTPIDAHLKKMESLRRDIIKFGYGIDFEDSRFGGNPNQLVIKSLYQNLDTYTDGLERHFQDFINNIKYFFDKWYEFSNKGSFGECQKYQILVKLDRSMLINQESEINATVQLANTGVSKKTLLEFNPVVQDVEMELERLKEEEKEKEVENSFFNFPQSELIEPTENVKEEKETENEEKQK